MKKFYLLSLIIFFAIIFTGFKKGNYDDNRTTGIMVDSSTWEIIQSEILDKNCIECHVEGSSYATQSGLILTSDVSYNNLIDATPKNTHAAEDGLTRVSSTGSTAGLYQSFFWTKINAPDQEHFYEDHPDYGSIMPLGLPYLTNGELNFIKEWIIEGAPETGSVVNPTVLEDSSRYEPHEFVPLTPPENGFQLHVGPVDIWPAEKWDREFLYFEPYVTEEDIFVKEIEISMREGSHHYILFNYPNGQNPPAPHIYRDLRTQSGTEHPIHANQLNQLFPFYFFAGTQTPTYNFRFPDNIALHMPKGTGFDHNLHSVNRSTHEKPGEVYVNVHTVEASEVEFVAYNGNFSNYNISLPPNQVITLSKTFYFSEKTHLIQMWTHAHEKMTEFKVIRVGGDHHEEEIYWTNDWQHPPYAELDPPMTFNAGEGVRLETTYNNWEDRTITYGTKSTDEMQFMFFIYFTGDLPTGVSESEAMPAEFSLHQNYPNPFNPTTTINYTLPFVETGPRKRDLRHAPSLHTTLIVYDVLGKELAILVNEEQNPGSYRVTFDAANLASGIYYYQLRAGAFAETRKMILLR